MTLREQYDTHGYVVVPTGLPEETLRAAQNAEGPLQPEGYHWSDGPRVFEAWKQSQAVRDVAWCPAVLDAIEELTGARVRPFQTINFRKGTNQRLHQDAVHFQTLPLGEMVGAWVALEPMDERNGTLCVVAKSHEQYAHWQGMGLDKCTPGTQYEQYAEYEDMVVEAIEYDHADIVCNIEAGVLSIEPIRCAAGDAVIWHANLLHGGTPIVDESRTRYSQATHYYTERARLGWAPMFSDPAALDFCIKSMRWFDRMGKQREFVEPWPAVGLY